MSGDHTFKVATNIACTLPEGSWSTQFDSLKIVLNETGQVLTYKRTKGVAMSKVEDILKNLNCRLDQQKAFCETLFAEVARFVANYNRFLIKVAHNSFLLFETYRTRCDFSGMKLYCFEWLTIFFKVTLHCTFHCV